MIKYIILLFNLLGLFLYQLFFQANVNVTQSVPASADAGSSFVVQVTINKADISGFAKFQEDLPKGFTATAIDKAGATVLSSDDAIKFIWASLPSDAAVKISFRITIDASVSGAQTLAGKFLYVVNNERQESDASSQLTVNGNASAPVASNTPSSASNPPSPATDTASQSANNSPPSQNSGAPATNNAPPVSTPPVTPPAPTITVSATRSLSSSTVQPAGDITVSITIHKGALSGFAKLEEDVPNGMVATEGDKQGSSFTFVDNKAKFVWLSLPADSVFTVSYKISVGSTVSSGDQSVSGEFSYLENNNAMKYEVAATGFTVQSSSSQPVANNTQPAANNQPAASNTEPVANNTQPAVNNTQPVASNTQPATNTQPAANNQPSASNTEPVANNTQPATNTPPVANNNEPPTNSVTPGVPSASASVNYRVQIMALHNPVKASFLARKYGINENIMEEMLDGYTKYTVGNYKEYKAVRDHREKIRNKGVKGPFVVAYNDGKRITVQEALMITHQQWYK